MGPQTAHLVHFETGDMNESSLTAFLSGHVDHPFPRLENLAEANHLGGVILGEVVHLEAVIGTPGKLGHKSRNRNASTASNLPHKCQSFATEKAKGATSSRQPRKRVPHKQVDELADEANDDSFTAKSYIDSKVNDDEYREHNTSQRKIVPRKAKKLYLKKNQFKNIRGSRKHLISQPKTLPKSSLIQFLETEDKWISLCLKSQRRNLTPINCLS
ncbi:hypothetical protein TB2_033963 [Malus domestica]